MNTYQVESLQPIDTFVVNLPKRTDRRSDIIQEFANKSEFKLTIVDAVEHSFGALGLWKTLSSIISSALEKNVEYILICEDDHKFTRNYSEKKLRESIEKTRSLGGEILLGGVSWSGDSVNVSQSLFWTKSFSGLQFTVVFKSFFEKFLNADLAGYDAADYHICSLTPNIFVIHPFISIQRSYPYSDATPRNNELGRVKLLFEHAESKLKKHKKVSKYFASSQRQKLALKSMKAFDTSQVVMPTYVINLKKRLDRKKHIVKQFNAREEFQIKICNGIENAKGQIGLWESIKKVIRIAKKANDDIIIICEDDHIFTDHYNKDFLIKNIVKAHALNADVLLGGICHFNSAVKASENLFWVDEFYCTQFMIVFENFFDAILNEKYDEYMSVDGKISAISANKLVLFPFVSIQQDFGYSDITTRDSKEIRSDEPFIHTMERLNTIDRKHFTLK